jgi:hypothetical protein
VDAKTFETDKGTVIVTDMGITLTFMHNLSIRSFSRSVDWEHIPKEFQEKADGMGVPHNKRFYETPVPLYIDADIALEYDRRIIQAELKK